MRSGHKGGEEGRRGVEEGGVVMRPVLSHFVIIIALCNTCRTL